MANTTYSGSKLNMDATYREYKKALEGESEIIVNYFPEHAREELREHFKNGIIPLEHFMNWKTRAKIGYDLYCNTLNFSDKLMEAIYCYGFIEGQRYADRSR